MKTLVLVSFLASFAPLTAAAGQTFKWTDDKGQVHYSDVVPNDKQAVAQLVDTDAAVSDHDRKLAEERLAKDRDYLKKASAATAPLAASAVPRAPSAPARGASSPATQSCEQAWKAYNDSYACFDPYRMSDGRLNLEAFQHCTKVGQPMNCPAPADH